MDEFKAVQPGVIDGLHNPGKITGTIRWKHGYGNPILTESERTQALRGRDGTFHAVDLCVGVRVSANAIRYVPRGPGSDPTDPKEWLELPIEGVRQLCEQEDGGAEYSQLRYTILSLPVPHTVIVRVDDRSSLKDDEHRDWTPAPDADTRWQSRKFQPVGGNREVSLTTDQPTATLDFEMVLQ